MRNFLTVFILTFFLSCPILGQESTTIRVFFLYGSKPARGYKNQEHKNFGGIHGGHVTIGVHNVNGGLVPYNGFHIFAHHKNLKSIFYCQNIKQFLADTVGSKYTTIEIPLTDSQYVKIKRIISDYATNVPYDYAFFGMRCASTAYDILSQVGIFKQKSRCGNIISNFYPKKLRKKLFKLANKNNWIVTKTNGRQSRKWEKD